MARFLFFLLSIAMATVVLAQSEIPPSDVALRCKAHPAFNPSLNPVLVSSWLFEVAAYENGQAAYLPRYKGHEYAPIEDTSSNKYIGLDLFHTANLIPTPTLKITFQRAARVYLFIDVENTQFNETKEVSLPRWKSEGWAVRTQGTGKITYGVQRTLTRDMTEYAYVLSKETGNKDFVQVPQATFIRQRISGVSVRGSFNLWISEADGTPSEPVGTFNGRVIQPNTKCPDDLHDTWVTPDDNPEDDDTKGVLFATWHPMWDPCYWCAYDHDHGSSPKDLMGYTPKFTYTAWKNNRQDEPSNGFKGYVMETGRYSIYYSLHIAMSSLRRTSVQFHTINLAIADRRTKELLLDIQQKGDFGFESVRLKGGRTFLAINEAEQAIRDAQDEAGSPINKRVINVLDVDNPNFDFELRSPRGGPNPITVGKYENWETTPMCGKGRGRDAPIKAIFKRAITGIKSLEEPDVMVDLGRVIDGKYYKQDGLKRDLIFRRLVISQADCPGAASGTFYTDPTGETVLDGPGPTAVRQFVKPGLNIALNGIYGPEDNWVGLHLDGFRGQMFDHGYGIDVDVN